jgi:predicted heme/steroid binding protein
MHTETNLQDADRAPQWLRKEWINLHRLKLDGVPILSFTWYSLTDQVDWDTALRENAGRVNPLGLYDLDPRRSWQAGRHRGSHLLWLLQKPDSSPELHWWLTAAVWIYFRNCSAHRQKIVTNIPIVANVIMTAAAHPK